MPNETMTESVMQTYNRFPLTLVKGKGSYVWDDAGEKYLDFSSGLATCNLGHVPEKVEQAVKEQLGELWHCSNLFHIPSQQQLAKLLADNSSLDQVFFCNSGAEANEAAIKIARRYAQEEAKNGRHEIVTFTQSFHGRTLTTLSATAQEKIQQGFAPLTPGFHYLPFNDFDAIKEVADRKPCAILVEMVQGEGGVNPASKEWMQALAQTCKENDILFMIDEIQTGFGRTGTLFAYEQYEVDPDVITLAKGLGSGLPIGAMLAKEQVAKAFSPGTHGSTFGGNPIVTTSGLATLKEIAETSLLSDIKPLIDQLWQGLEQIASKYDVIKEVRGKGFLIGVEVEGQAIDYITKAREEYQTLIIVAGPNVIRILPPLTTNKEEIEAFLNTFEKLFAE
ncbi:acetylornithine transaminase [Saliterribacillus persicus]|uniref:Acetylornithine aminotransferase n=1 Tax=Saliterribacillus persicus TaxID=930114 RepID=A0A368YF07_9BACI|nr:acetylornithine transaminase [Saliterribacillus persicus]RCW76764.1 acetylornithine aminotransferase [Saliterribacillus persicus]